MIQANLAALIQMHATTSPAVAAASGLSRKTLNDMLNAKYDPRLANVEAVARVFGLSAWQLLAHDMSRVPAGNKQIFELLERYVMADERGREAIMQVAAVASDRATKEPA